MPWRFDPPTLTYKAWARWESRLTEEANARKEEGSETYEDDRRRRLLATGRLFTLENVIDGFSVRHSVANVLNKSTEPATAHCGRTFRMVHLKVPAAEPMPSSVQQLVRSTEYERRRLDLTV